MFLRIYFLLLILLVSFTNVHVYAEDKNVENSVISNIIIKGNNRVTDNTILSYSNVEEGDRFSPELSEKDN